MLCRLHKHLLFFILAFTQTVVPLFLNRQPQSQQLLPPYVLNHHHNRRGILGNLLSSDKNSNRGGDGTSSSAARQKATRLATYPDITDVENIVREFICLVNSCRRGLGIQELAMSGPLMKIAVDHTNLMAQNRALSSHFEHEPGLFDQTIEQGFDSDYTVFDSLIVQDIRTPQGVVKSWIVDENTNSQGTSIDATTRRGRSGGGQPTAFEILTRPEFEYIGVGNSLTFSTLLFASGEPKSKHHQGSTSSNSVDNVARFSAYKKFYVENCERYDGLGDYDAKSISDACVAEMLTFTNNSNTGSSEPGNDNNNDSDDLNDNDNDSDSDDSNDYDDNDSKNKSHS